MKINHKSPIKEIRENKAKRKVDKGKIKNNPVIQNLAGKSPDEIAAYIDSNVNNLDDAKALLSILTATVVILMGKNFGN